MAILKIARMGHPVLKVRAAPVADPGTAEIAHFNADMVETLDDAGGIGLAAPQVHVPLRVVIIEVPAARLGAEESEAETVPRRVLINPVITPQEANDVESIVAETVGSRVEFRLTPGLYLPRLVGNTKLGPSPAAHMLDFRSDIDLNAKKQIPNVELTIRPTQLRDAEPLF